MEKEFDYTKAIEELEAMAAKVEDPQTGISDIDRYMKRAPLCLSKRALTHRGLPCLPPWRTSETGFDVILNEVKDL